MAMRNDNPPDYDAGVIDECHPDHPDHQPIRKRIGFKAVREMLQGVDVQVLCAPMTYPRGASFLIVSGDSLLEAHWNPKRKKGLWRVAWVAGFMRRVKLSNPAAMAVDSKGSALCVAFTQGAWTRAHGSGPVRWWDTAKREPCVAPHFELEAPEARHFTPSGLGKHERWDDGTVRVKDARLKMGRVCGYCTSIPDLLSLVLGELRAAGACVRSASISPASPGARLAEEVGELIKATKQLDDLKRK